MERRMLNFSFMLESPLQIGEAKASPRYKFQLLRSLDFPLDDADYGDEKIRDPSLLCASISNVHFYLFWGKL